MRCCNFSCLEIPLWIAVFGNAVVSLTTKYVANATITPMAGSSGRLYTGTQPSPSMCAVQANGLAPIGDGPPSPEEYSTACSCNAIVSSVVTMGMTTVTGMDANGSLWSETEPVKTVTDPSYVPPQDCCVECLITAKDVQILYWPVETASSGNNQSTTNMTSPAAQTPYTLISDGQTFISPSVYVAYRSLGAAENCPAFGPGYFPHGETFDTTIGYPPEALSTSMCNGPPAGFQLYTAINYTELQYPTGSQTQGTCEWRINSSGTPRGPYLSIPQDISQVKPSWATCTGAFEGTFDPPSALKKGTALVAQTPKPKSSPAASPGPSIAPINSPPTVTPPPLDPGSSGQHSVAHMPQPQKTNLPAPVFAIPDSDPSNAVDPPASGNSNNGSPGGSPNNPAPDLAPEKGGSEGSSDPLQNDDPSDPQNAGGTTGEDPGSAAASHIVPNSIVSGGNTIIRDPGGGVVVAGSTYMPGGTAQIAGTPLSVAPNHVIFGGSSYPLPAATPANAVLVGGQSIVKGSNGGVVIGDTTITPGGQVAVAGHTIFVGPSNALIDGSTYALPSNAGAVVQAAAPTPSPVLVAGQSMIRAPNAGIVIGGSTIAPGFLATIAGHTVSVGSSVAEVDGTTYAIPTSPGAVIQQASNADQEIAVHSDLTLANGAVITAGGAAATVDGAVIAIPSGDNGLIINGQTVPLPTPAPASIFTIAGQTFTAAPTGFTLDGHIVSPGGSAITLAGTVISLGTSGLQIGTSTIPLPAALPSVFTVAGQTFTAAPTGFTLDGQTVSPGGSAITVSGTVVSLGPSGLEIGTSTIALTPAEQSADAVGLGTLIMGGFGASSTGSATSGTGVVGFTGGSPRLNLGKRSLCLGIGFGVAMALFLL